MSNPTLSIDELLAEVERVHGREVEGVSCNQLAATLDRTVDWVRKKLLAPAIAAGRCRFVGRRRQSRIDGAMTLVPVYAFATDAVAKPGANKRGNGRRGHETRRRAA